MEELATLDGQRTRRRMADHLVGAGVDRRTVISAPGVAEPARGDLLMHQPGDLDLREAGPKRLRDALEDLLRRRGRRAHERHLLRRLASPHGVDDVLRGDEPLWVRRAGERLLELEPEAVGETVRGRVAPRVVERDRARIEPLDRLAERGADALVVADHLAVRPHLLEARRVEAADDRDPLAARPDEERALPRAVGAGDQVEARVLRQQRLADERQPEIDVLLSENAGGLLELLMDERWVAVHEDGP